MAPSEFFGFLGLGLPVGLFLLALLSGQDRAAIRRKVTAWCLQAGGVSVAIALVVLLTGFQLGPSKAALGIVFVGLPAFTAGILLLFLAPTRSPSNEKAASNGGGNNA